MAIQISYPFDDGSNYSYNMDKVEVTGGVARLNAQFVAADADLYAKLDDNKGLVATDSSGNARHGAFQLGLDETNWTTGKISTGAVGAGATTGIINFDQTLAYERTDTFSLEFWLKFDTNADQGILTKRSNTGGFVGFEMVTDNKRVKFTIADDAANIIQVGSTTDRNDGQWHHYVCTYDGTGTVDGTLFYVDGQADKALFLSGTLTGSILTDADLQISGRDGNNLCMLDETVVDEVILYNRVLGPADVAFRWNNGDGTQQIPGAETSFPIDNPTIQPVGSMLVAGVSSFNANVIVSGSDLIKYVFVINGVPTYYNGASWATSDGTYSQSNTLAEVQAALGSLSLSANTTFKPLMFLHSAGTTTPQIQDVTIEVSQSAFSVVAPDECLVFGYVYNGEAIPVENVVVTASLIRPAEYARELVITPEAATAITDADGLWQMSLVENTSMFDSFGYRFTFVGQGINYTFNKRVPAEVTKNFAELRDL